MRRCQTIKAFLTVFMVAIGARVTSQANQHHPQTSHLPQVLNHQAFLSRSVRSEATRESCSGAGGYLLADPTDMRLNQSDPLDSLLADILGRPGPDMRPLRDFRDFSDISVEVAKRAWRLMHHHAQVAMSGRLQSMQPLILEALKAANVSNECQWASIETMEAAMRLDSWAIQLLSSWGNFPPTGIFEGTYGDIGSFHGCVNVPANQAIGHAHYCTIAYRPVLPTRGNYDLIIDKEPAELLNIFATNQSNRVDAFTEILTKSQYSHYLYYKFGTCFPIACSPHDIQRLAKLLGRRNILMSGPVKCHSKYANDYDYYSSSNSSSSKKLVISTRDVNEGVYIWKPHTTATQQVALVIVCIITCAIVSLTLVDIVSNRIPQLYKYHELRLRQDRSLSARTSNGSSHVANGGHHLGNGGINDKGIPLNDATTCLGRQTEEEEEEEEEKFDANNNRNSGMQYKFQENSQLEKETTGRLNHSRSVSENHVGGPRAKSPVITMMADGAGGGQQQVGGEFVPETCGGAAARASLKQRSLFMQLVDDCSIVTNAQQFFQVSGGHHLKNDILCINGIRCITMSWIIVTHTMQYNDWSAFARTHEIETHLKSLINQPLFNGSYLVDTFFLVSGLLTSFSSFRRCSSATTTSTSNGQAPATNNHQEPPPPVAHLLEKFSSRSYLIGRYLRLTPQVLFVSLLFILLPLASRSGGPHWYTITGEYSENCSQNWWVNLLYLQAFYRSDKMCNFVCWWISVDMFYHLFALLLILLIYYQSRRWLASTTTRTTRDTSRSEGRSVNRLVWMGCAAVCLLHALPQVYKHFRLQLPPNLLSTIPQTGAMWSHMTLELFWTPWAHAYPFFLGFYLGYLMARHDSQLRAWFTWRRSLIGWSLAIGILILQSYSTYFWVIGRWRYTRLMATLFHIICPITWSTCLAWIILACQYGYGTIVNRLLSCKLFIILGKASYIVYLSHFLILFTFFGSQNLLLEPTQLVMSYVIIGNICLAMLLGCALCICFEMPWLKSQRRLMRHVR